MLEISEREVTRIDWIPPETEVIFCQGNKLKTLPEIPEKVTMIMAHQNNFESFPDLPMGIKAFGYSDNPLTQKYVSYHNTKYRENEDLLIKQKILDSTDYVEIQREERTKEFLDSIGQTLQEYRQTKYMKSISLSWRS